MKFNEIENFLFKYCALSLITVQNLCIPGGRVDRLLLRIYVGFFIYDVVGFNYV